VILPEEAPSLRLIEAALHRGMEAQRMVWAARMLQGYELMFWDMVYTLSTEGV
jgi:hypothetical protein